MKDLLKHKGKRNLLIKKLHEQGIINQAILLAIQKVPRHFFIDSVFEDFAYQDKAFPILSNQTISRPYTVALQTQLLEFKAGDRILEIGTGSGYQTSVLVAMQAKVYSIERQYELFKKTKVLLAKLRIQPKQLLFGDGYLGLPKEAPFDGILVTAGAPEVPTALLKQLKIGGKLIIPLGIDNQEMTVITKESEKHFERQTYGACKFVPMIENKI